MKRELFNLIMVMSFLVGITNFTVAQDKPNKTIKKDHYEMVVNAEIESKLNGERVTGRTSLNFKASKEDLKKGVIKAQGLNVIFTKVDQSQFSSKIDAKNKLGYVGLALDRNKPQMLKINKKGTRIEGELKMYLDASVLNSVIIQPENGRQQDEFLTPTIPATCYIDIELSKPISSEIEGMGTIDGEMRLKIKTEKASFEDVRFESFEIDLRPTRIDLEIGIIWLVECARILDIQPVFLRRISFVSGGWWQFPWFQIEETGIGLPFGEPQLRHEWRKVDVIFNIREPMYVFRSDLFDMEDSENASLRATVDEDDAIEVFFPEQFTPQALYGGGACFGSGSGSAKVISSDENAVFGIDLTHLAHEFGHVLGLRHPTSSATSTAVPGNTGTLICPSGFANDNPQFNSEEHRDLISNPLLRYTLTLRSSLTPDCLNSLDCGSCN